MKRVGPDHPKISRLMELLNCDKPTAVGIVELMWHFTAKYAPQGNIGKHSDAVIANAVGWKVRSGRRGVRTEVMLRSALVDAGLLDRCEEHRLVVHDWSDHADQSVRRALAKQKLDFVRPKTSQPVPEPEPEPVPVAGGDQPPRPPLPPPPLAEKTKPIPDALRVAFERCAELHPNADIDAAGRALVSLWDVGKITVNDAPKLEPGMHRWLKSELWSPGQGRFSRIWRAYSAWLLEKAWTSHPAPSEAAKAEEEAKNREYIEAPADWPEFVQQEGR